MNAVQPDLYNIGCISCQSKLSHVDQNHDISGRERGPCSGDSYLLQNSMTSMINIWVHWRMLDHYVMNPIHIIIVLILLQMMLGNLTRDRLTLINVAVEVSLIKYLTKKKMKLVDVAQIYLSRGSESECTSTYVLQKSDYKGSNGTDGRSWQNSYELVETKWAAPSLTYSRRSRKDEDTCGTYVDSLSKRTNYVISDQIFSGSAGRRTHIVMPKFIERSKSDTVVDHNASFSPPIEKFPQLTYRNSASGAVLSGQGNQKKRNRCRLIDDVEVSKVLALNDEAVIGKQPDDALENSQNQ